MSDAEFLAGVRLLRDRRYFEAHEALEEVWQPTPPGPRREALQAVIQLAVALEHLRRGNANGCFALWNKARGRVAAGEDWTAEGLGVAGFLERTSAFLTGEAALADRVRAQLEGGVAADAEAGHVQVAPLPPDEAWPVPPLRDPLAAEL